mgnify:CR=1 FL=1
MKEIINKNKKTLVVILILLLVLVIASTYAWLRLTKSSNVVNKITAGNLDIILDEGESITLKNEVPRSYRQGMETKEYTFTLTNKGSESNYKLSLADLEKYTDEDGKEIVVADENRINDSKIRYILLKDGEVATADKSKILTDRTIDTGTIKKGQTISYTLRVWIDSRAENEVMGKIFNARLSLKAEQVSTATPVVKTVCKRATTLHTEECKQTVYYAYCSADGYTASGTMGTTMITYGNLGEKGQLQTGDAFDCDVNGDGIYDSATERFYYISEITNGVTLDSDTAVLVYYSNVNEGLPSNSKAAYDSSGKNYNGPVTAIKQLPTTSQWKNVSLIKAKRAITTEKGTTATDYGGTGILPIAFDYSSYAARLLTAQEINSGCKITVGKYNNGDLSNKCKFLMENTNYSTTLLSVYGFWLESPNESNSFYGWGIVGDNRTVTNSTVSDKSNYFGVRPAIEVAKENIEY